MASQVILFKNAGQYDNFNTMIDEISDEYRLIGYSVNIIDVREPDYMTKLFQSVRQGSVHCFLNLACFGFDGRAHNNIYNHFDAPLLSLYFDPIILYLSQLEVPIRRRLVTTTCDSDFGYWNRRVISPVDLRHLPHAAAPRPSLEWHQRRLDVVFSGGGPEDPEEIRAGWTRFGALNASRLNRIVEVWQAGRATDHRPLTGIIEEAIGGEVDLGDPHKLYPFFQAIDGYIRHRVRWNSVLALADRPVWVVGLNWDRLRARCAGGRIQFHGPCSVMETNALVAEARICLNTATPHHGSHERVFRTMATTTLSLSSTTSWYDDNAPEGVMVQYDSQHDDLRAIVDGLLATPDRVREIAEAGNRWFLAHHTWRPRVALLERWTAEKWGQ